jgi:hypothetical protein
MSLQIKNKNLTNININDSIQKNNILYKLEEEEKEIKFNEKELKKRELKLLKKAKIKKF